MSLFESYSHELKLLIARKLGGLVAGCMFWLLRKVLELHALNYVERAYIWALYTGSLNLERLLAQAGPISSALEN